MQLIQGLSQKERDQATNEFLECAKSPSYFATKHCWTLDIEKNEERLFPDYSYLIDFLESNKFPQLEMIEKSRQMMASWAFMILFLWDITFNKNIADFITSRKEFLVDDGGSLSTPNSLMGRIRYVWERLPSFLKMPLEISFLKIRNAFTGSYIIGESSNPNAGRSGTWHRALMDEAALIPKSESVFSSIIQACKKGLSMNSTPYGRGGCFARIRFARDTDFKKRKFHWRLHPERDNIWYKKQCKNMTPDSIARELDISYEKSVAGQIWFMFDFNKQIGKYPYNPDLPLFLGWDYGVGNPTAILWIQEKPIPGEKFPMVYIIDELEESEKMPPYYADIVKSKPYTIMSKDSLKPKLKEMLHYGDPAGKQREVNMKSWISWLEELGIKTTVKYGVRTVDKIMAGQQLVPNLRIDESCVRIQECISNYKHPTDDQGLVIDDGYEKNWATHLMKAFEEYAVNRFPVRMAKITAR